MMISTYEIEDLIETAEQASDPQEIDTGKKARIELTAILAELESMRAVVEAARAMVYDFALTDKQAKKQLAAALERVTA